MLIDIVGLFLFCAGFVIGLGAVTVIDIHGFLGRKSEYWTEATIRTHKVTKPLIWIGTFLVALGGFITYRNESLSGIPLIHLIILCVLVLNGLFLSFYVSPFLLTQEKEGRAQHLLPSSLQRSIAISLVCSDIGWWGGLLLFAIFIVKSF